MYIGGNVITRFFSRIRCKAADHRAEVSMFGAVQNRFSSIVSKIVILCAFLVVCVTAHADLQSTSVDALYNKLVDPASGLTAKWTQDGKEYMRPVYPNQFKDEAGNTLIGPTVSEGTAYMMVFAAVMDDKATFDANYNYWRQFATGNIGQEFREEDGQDLYKWLMPWLIAADGRVISKIPAADADLDIAYALLVADSRWSGYRSDFESVLTAIREQLMMPNLKIVRPWPMKWTPAEYGEYSYYITSYNMPGYYRIFGRATNDEAYWSDVSSSTYDWIDQHIHPLTGLNSYAAFADGTYCINRDFCDQFEVDAMRLPLRLAQALAWDDKDTRAKAILDKVASWTTTSVSTNFVPAAFYTSGEAAVNYSSPGMRACLASAAASNSNYEWWSNTIWDQFESNGVTGDVYQHMVTLMAMLTIDNRLIDPTKRANPVEPPSDTTNDLANALVSIQDGWKGYYMNVGEQKAWIPAAGQGYNAEWGSMQWQLESVDGRANTYRLKNLWTGLYLTASSEQEWQPVLQAPLEPTWTSMHWQFEAIADAGSKYRIRNAWTQQHLSASGNTGDAWTTAILGSSERLNWGSLQFELRRR